MNITNVNVTNTNNVTNVNNNITKTNVITNMNVITNANFITNSTATTNVNVKMNVTKMNKFMTMLAKICVWVYKFTHNTRVCCNIRVCYHIFFNNLFL